MQELPDVCFGLGNYIAVWTDLRNSVDRLITAVEKISPEKKRSIILKSENAEHKQLERLKRNYELGYAILYMDGRDWYYIPRNMKRKLDWMSTKITSVSEDTIEIQLPSFVDSGLNRWINPGIGLSRKAGATSVAFQYPDVSIVAECLEASGDSTVAVVGITQRKDVKSK